jgi:putative inorganic carbon (hco3(-)) transporter
MAEDVLWRPRWYMWVAGGLALALLVHARAGWLLEGDDALPTAVAIIALSVAGAALWEMPPAVMMCGAVAFTLFSGNWSELGLPGFPFLPDRVLVFGAILALLLRAPGARGAPRPMLRPVHILLLVTILYATISAASAGTLVTEQGGFALLDLLGVVPYLMLLVAPAVFHSARERKWLLVTLVGIGLYLGLTAIFEAIGPSALVFPHYVVSSDLFLGGRAGGPFRASDTEGFATFSCGIAALIAFIQWRGHRRRYVALIAAFVSMLGCFLTLERGAWIGAVAGLVIAGLAARELRRWLAPMLLVGALAVVGLLVLSPALASRTSSRVNDQLSVWDRQNMTTAGLRMLTAKPLLGFGWDNYENTNEDYFRQASDYPMTGLSANSTEQRVPLHDTYLSFAVDLGLIGGLLWLSALLWGVGGSILTRGSPELRLWKLGLVAIFVCYLTLALVDPLSQNFSQLVLWTWAGVCVSSSAARTRVLPRVG